MALNIEELRKPTDGAMYVSPQRLCVTADDHLCECDDPAAVRLLVGEGCEIPNAEAAKYGLIASEEPEEQEEGPAALTVAELRELAEERGVDLPAQARKAEIIAALEQVETESAEEDEG